MIVISMTIIAIINIKLTFRLFDENLMSRSPIEAGTPYANQVLTSVEKLSGSVPKIIKTA